MFTTGGNANTLALIFPTWAGITSFERGVAKRLNEQGIDALVVDYHGRETDLSTMEGRQRAMQALIGDFSLFRAQLLALMDGLAEVLDNYQHQVCLGYCLGGLSAIQLGLIYQPLRAAISFHGLLSFAKDLPPLHSDCSFLILNGSADPMVPERDIADTLVYFETHRLDMTLVSFSQTMHSFSIPGSHNPQNGVDYHPDADRRSWRYAVAHLDEMLEGAGRC